MTNKASPNEKAIDTLLTPRPRTYESKEYYGAAVINPLTKKKNNAAQDGNQNSLKDIVT